MEPWSKQRSNCWLRSSRRLAPVAGQGAPLDSKHRACELIKPRLDDVHLEVLPMPQRCLLIQIKDDFSISRSFPPARRRCALEKIMMQTTIAYLERRHLDLEREIANALHHSPTDDLAIADLRYRKLIVADEIQHNRRLVERFTSVN